jgi:hypothetical protein
MASALSTSGSAVRSRRLGIDPLAGGSSFRSNLNAVVRHAARLRSGAQLADARNPVGKDLGVDRSSRRFLQLDKWARKGPNGGVRGT